MRRFARRAYSVAFFNGDLALKASELNPVVDAILDSGLRFQAMHQHSFDLDPMVWFVHLRGLGEPLRLARAVRKVLRATSRPTSSSFRSTRRAHGRRSHRTSR